MTLNGIKDKAWPDTYEAVKLKKAHTPEMDIRLIWNLCPWCKYEARAFAAEYEEKAADKLSQDDIKTYLLRHHDYDVVDISHLIAAYKKYREETLGK